MEVGPILRAMLQNRMRVAVLVVEVAVTLAIVLNCLTMISSQRARITRPTGIDEAHLIAVTVRPWTRDLAEYEARIQVVDRDLAALRALPGVRDATIISTEPLQGGGSSFQLRPMGADDSKWVRSPVYGADPHVFDTLGLEIVAGRGFTDADLPTGPDPRPANVVVTRDLADALFPDGNALGQLVDTGDPESPGTIVGIVGHMFTPYGGGPMESRITFYPSKPADPDYMLYLVRTQPDAYDGVFAKADEALLSVYPDRSVAVTSLLDVKAGGISQNIILARILWVIVWLLLFVTTLGIFGMASFSVAQRTKQIGTRRAIGATRGAVLRHFLVESSLVTGMGVVLGLPVAYGLNIALVNTIGGTALDGRLVLAAVVGLWLLGLVATLAPARRASRIAPALATRTV